MITINVVGDFCVSNINGLTFSKTLSAVLNTADINILNLEAPVSNIGSKPIKKSGPNICQHSDVPLFLESNGFNAIAMSNNHILDFGEEAYYKTIKSFSKAITFGAGTFEEAYQIKVCKAQGLKIGLLGLSQYEFGIHSDIIDSKDKIGVAWMCHPCIDELIVNAKRDCDFLLLMPHAGLENYEYPLPELCTLYRHFIDMGADAIVGGHPHIPQSHEMYKDKLIIYSLGNFCFDSLKEENRMWNTGLLVSLKMDDSKKVETIIRYTHFNNKKRIIDLIEDSNVDKYFSTINKVFQDNQAYLLEINRKCLELRPFYTDLFELSGLYEMNSRKVLGYFYRRLKNKLTNKHISKPEKTHYINNLRCETHRWVLSRIYELTND